MVFSVSCTLKVPLTTLIKQNSLIAEISPGDLLYIETDGKPYIVQPFDTLSKIAQKFNTTEQKLRQDNGINYIFYGLSLKI